MSTWTVHVGDVIEQLRALPAEFVQCVVTRCPTCKLFVVWVAPRDDAQGAALMDWRESEDGQALLGDKVTEDDVYLNAAFRAGYSAGIRQAVTEVHPTKPKGAPEEIQGATQ